MIKNKILNKFNEKESSYKSSKKETNINADNPPSEPQIKKYENNFEFQYLKSFQLFQQINSIKDIIDLIIKLIEENNYKIEEKENNINLIILSNISNVPFYLFKKKNIENSIKLLIDGIKEEIKNMINEERNEMMKEIIEIKEIIKIENNKIKEEKNEIKK